MIHYFEEPTDDSLSPCAICNRNIGINHKFVKCSICNYKIHIKCNKTDDATFEKYEKNSDPIFWLKCQEEIIPFQNLSDEQFYTTLEKGIHNVNRRLNEMLKNISPVSERKPDIVFVMETSIGYEAIPNINGYTKYAGKNIPESNHAGIAFYLLNELASPVFNINFNTSFISFRLDFIPKFLFIGSYIQPEESRYFEPCMFSELCSFLLTAQERKFIPIMDDVNCRLAEVNVTFVEGLVYEMNVDSISNIHGRMYGKGMCKMGGILTFRRLSIQLIIQFYFTSWHIMA